MENYQYPPSYPDSGNSSPRSREIDFENPSSWEDQQNYKAKFMCSYGGKIQPRSHDNQLSYIGGDTKILAVDRNIKFQQFLSKLSSLCEAPQQEISFKYQLPGEELDALISVTNEDDLEHMMHEYDRLYRPSSKPVRMRLFLFISPNSGSVSQPDPLKSQSNVDFLFGLENKTLAQPPSYAAVKYHDPVPVPDLVAPTPEYPPRGVVDDRVEIQAQLQRLQVSEIDQSLYRRSVDGFTGGFAAGGAAPPGGDYYMQKLTEKVTQSNSPSDVHHPTGYWPEKQFPGDGFPMTGTNSSGGGGDQQVFMIPPPGAFYQTAPVMRPPTAQVTQGYYAVQRMASDGYREQPVYGGVPPQQVAFSSVGQGSLAPAQPVKPSGYAEGYGVVRPASVADNVGAGAGYTQVAYDSASGRHFYYTAQGGVVHAPQFQGNAPVFSSEMRPAVVPVGQDPKGVNINKSSQGSV